MLVDRIVRGFAEDQIIPLEISPFIVSSFSLDAVLLVLRLPPFSGSPAMRTAQRDSRFDANSADVISINSGRRADIAEGWPCGAES